MTKYINRFTSFKHAFRGIGFLVKSQINARIHFGATLAVVFGGIYFMLTRAEWTAVILAMGLVWAAEALNTAVECLADATIPEQNTCVGRAKDVAAGGVLLAAIAAALVGVLVFGPYLIRLIGLGH